MISGFFSLVSLVFTVAEDSFGLNDEYSQPVAPALLVFALKRLQPPTRYQCRLTLQFSNVFSFVSPFSRLQKEKILGRRNG